MSAGQIGPRGEQLRLFVALELPGDVRLSLSRWRESLLTRALRPVPTESLHVTLCFLGSLPVAELPAIGDACAAALAGGESPPFGFGEALWLPRRRPQVLAVALLDPSGELGSRQATLGEALARGGWYQPESRPFLAHVTVARVRRGARVRAVDLPAPPELRFSGERVALFRSHLGAGGARYEALRVF